MLTLEEARARWLSDVRPLSVERMEVRRAAGRVLARDLVAQTPWPRFDHSAMDGYALRSEDFVGVGPWTLDVVEGGKAGAVPADLEPRVAARIMTGAPLPRGADTVVMQEHVVRDGARARFTERPSPGQHVRRTGEDIEPGKVALSAGSRLGPGALALAAMLDCPDLVVARRPVVVVLCTGDELRAAGAPGRLGSIPESNSAALLALAAQAGACGRVAPIVADEPLAVERAVREALQSADVVVTVGGVSVGEHDFVRPALERADVALEFWKVAIKPGKPIAVGRAGSAYVLGLPGNPASALVTFALFGMPLLRALQGDRRPMPIPLPAALGAARKRSPDRVELLRASLAVERGHLVARPHDNQASGAATSLAVSDGLAVVAPGQGPIEAGAAVDFLQWGDL